MRTWRVGSFSMGASLVLLGVSLLCTQVFNWDAGIILLSWWPVIFIVLGLEILLYLRLSRLENTPLKYDFISIIFVACIGTFGLMISMLNFTGLLDFATHVVRAEESTMNLPTYRESVSEQIERISVDAGTGPYEIVIESSVEDNVAIFGTYRGLTDTQTVIDQVSDYALIEKQGDTLYITLKELPTNRFIDYRGGVKVTLLIPAEKSLEVNGNGRNIEINPRHLKSDWLFTNMGDVQIERNEQDNLEIEATQIYDVNDEDAWDTITKEQNEEKITLAYLKYGEGNHLLKIRNSYSIELF